jgi:hypothetical protein
MDTSSGRGIGRRQLIGKLAVGGALVWTTPSLLSTAAGAQGSGLVGFVAVSNAEVPNPPNNSSSQNMVVNTPSGVATGNLMLAVVAIDHLDTMATPGGWTLVSGPNDVTGGGRNVRSYLFRRTVTATEPTTHTFVITVTGNNHGVGRVAVAAYSAPTPPSVNAMQRNLNSTPSFMPAWPSVAAAPMSLVVRLGAASQTTGGNVLAWTSPNPAGSVRLQNTPLLNTGSRTLHISDGLGSAAAAGTLSLERRSVTYSVAIA